MAVEIERRFLVKNDLWRGLAPGRVFRQGYLAAEKGRSVRIRTEGDRAVITVKGAAHGASRLEFEYPIPFADCTEMLEKLAIKPLIEKTRTRIPESSGTGLVWEVDDFHGANAGLVVAEIELPDPETPFEKPAWLGREVTGVARYLNAALARRPYSTWDEAERLPADEALPVQPDGAGVQ